MNELLFAATLILNFGGITLAFRYFGKNGLYAWVALATITANIEVAKCVDIFGLSLTLGNVTYGTTFLATDILSELYGGKEARKAVALGFVLMVLFTLMTQMSLLFQPNAEDIASAPMRELFALLPRICLASLFTYFVSNMLDTYLYDWWKRRCPDKLWLRNNASTMTSQLVDSFLFTFLSFSGLIEWRGLVELSLTTYAVKLIVAAADTPFLYLAARKMKHPD